MSRELFCDDRLMTYVVSEIILYAFLSRRAFASQCNINDVMDKPTVKWRHLLASNSQQVRYCTAVFTRSDVSSRSTNLTITVAVAYLRTDSKAETWSKQTVAVTSWRDLYTVEWYEQWLQRSQLAYRCSRMDHGEFYRTRLRAEAAEGIELNILWTTEQRTVTVFIAVSKSWIADRRQWNVSLGTHHTYNSSRTPSAIVIGDKRCYS